jgi:hypothetical protein
LRSPAHDSGSRWIASPFLCGSFIRYSMPVYPGAYVAVGTPVAGRPPHRSVQEELLHTALTSGRTRPPRRRGGPYPCPPERPAWPGTVSGAGPAKQEFPLVDPLPSTDSAAAHRPALFARFVGTTRSSDSSGTCVSGVRLAAFPDRPASKGSGRPRGLPVLAPGASTHAQGLRLRGARQPLAWRDCRCGLPSVRTRSARRRGDFGARWLACVFPCQRFTHDLAAKGA